MEGGAIHSDYGSAVLQQLIFFLMEATVPRNICLRVSNAEDVACGCRTDIHLKILAEFTGTHSKGCSVPLPASKVPGPSSLPKVEFTRAWPAPTTVSSLPSALSNLVARRAAAVRALTLQPEEVTRWGCGSLWWHAPDLTVIVVRPLPWRRGCR